MKEESKNSVLSNASVDLQIASLSLKAACNDLGKIDYDIEVSTLYNKIEELWSMSAIVKSEISKLITVTNTKTN